MSMPDLVEILNGRSHIYAARLLVERIGRRVFNRAGINLGRRLSGTPSGDQAHAMTWFAYASGASALRIPLSMSHTLICVRVWPLLLTPTEASRRLSGDKARAYSSSQSPCQCANHSCTIAPDSVSQTMILPSWEAVTIHLLSWEGTKDFTLPSWPTGSGVFIFPGMAMSLLY